MIHYLSSLTNLLIKWATSTHGTGVLNSVPRSAEFNSIYGETIRLAGRLGQDQSRLDNEDIKAIMKAAMSA